MGHGQNHLRWVDIKIGKNMSNLFEVNSLYMRADIDIVFLNTHDNCRWAGCYC